jgi:hypothetical protein
MICLRSSSLTTLPSDDIRFCFLHILLQYLAAPPPRRSAGLPPPFSTKKTQKEKRKNKINKQNKKKKEHSQIRPRFCIKRPPSAGSVGRPCGTHAARLKARPRGLCFRAHARVLTGTVDFAMHGTAATATCCFLKPLGLQPESDQKNDLLRNCSGELIKNTGVLRTAVSQQVILPIALSLQSQWPTNTQCGCGCSGMHGAICNSW